MKIGELKEITTRALDGEGNVNDAILISSASFESFSRHLKEVQAQQAEILRKLNEISKRLETVSEHTTDWVYRAIVED